MKFKDMPYKRPDMDEVMARGEALLGRLQSAQSAEDVFAAYRELEDLSTEIETMFSLAFIRNSLDTTDSFYDAEKAFADENMPLLTGMMQKISLALVSSPYRAAMEREWGGLMFRNIEISLKAFSEALIPDMQQENKLTSEYDKLLASAQIEFDGKKLTLAQLTPYQQDKDAAVRRAATDARAAWFMSHAERLDSLFDELVRLRTRMAKTLGYENYIELGYYQMQRNCYDQDMVARFREGVRKYIVPLATRLKAEQAARIGVERITMYDDAFEHPDGNARPKGTPEEIFAHGRKMYHELSPDTAEFIDFMLENDLFDVLTRPGKSGGGYCAHIPAHKSPFIFANFNGTAGDVEVLTHEAGHAFSNYVSRDLYPSALTEYGYETAEVHSMSMEFLTWPWMEGFFGEETDKFYYSHLAGALTFIPYGTMVDDFQHRVYQNPDMTPAERNALWLELEAMYRPYLDLEGCPFFGEGRRWQAQSHIYERPFYYIDYCLAQTMALAFWAEDQRDRKAAWDKYRRFVGYSGTKTFADIIEAVGLPTPFESENLKIIADAAMTWLSK